MPALAAIILARLDSRRFPGKALQRLEDMTVIEHVLRRLEHCNVFDSIVLATTARACDDALAAHFTALGGQVYRATEDEVNDVARRFVSAARSVGAVYALRANGDSPFLDPWLVREGVHLLITEPDLATNLLPRSYPYGVSVEIVKVSALASVLEEMDNAEREHVTAFIYNHAERFQIASTPMCPWPACSTRLTIDEPQDLERLQRLIQKLQVPALEIGITSMIAAANAEQTSAK